MEKNRTVVKQFMMRGRKLTTMMKLLLYFSSTQMVADVEIITIILLELRSLSLLASLCH